MLISRRISVVCSDTAAVGPFFLALLAAFWRISDYTDTHTDARARARPRMATDIHAFMRGILAGPGSYFICV